MPRVKNERGQAPLYCEHKAVLTTSFTTRREKLRHLAGLVSPNPMMCTEVEDALRPTDDAFKAIYEQGYRTWYNAWERPAGDCSLPSTCLDPEQLFPQHPVLPVGLDLDDSGLVTANSTWISSEGHCNIPAFEQTFQIAAAIGKPTSTALADHLDLMPFEWFGKDDGHHVVLIFAWAYVLSARWSEILPRASPIEYITTQAPWIAQQVSGEAGKNDRPMVVDLGNLTGEAARWWEAVLAPGEGWRAAMPHERWRLLSPWSVTKESTIPIFLTGSLIQNNSYPPTAASFEAELQYIGDYSAFHGASTQSRAALAAALRLPVAKLDNRKILLPVSRKPCSNPAEKTAPKALLFEGHYRRQFDGLLTLSANARRMKAVLGSVFYGPGIPANACGAWLQGTMAVLQSKGSGNLQVLAHMFFDWSPHISYLWLGGIITGAHRDFLRNTSSLLGLNRIDLDEAAWSGTLWSFIQEPVSLLHLDSESISRADECRLMFLTQDPPPEFPPIYPYSPLGDTNIQDADLGVQLHAFCPGKHGLRFMSLTWNCVGGRKDIQSTGPISIASSIHITSNSFDDKDIGIKVDYAWLDRERDLSEGVTSNLFTWMREMNGFTVAERDIYRHEWIDAFDSDDESVHLEGDGGSTTGLNLAGQMGYWMASTMTRRCNSV